jgi:hypothetical protein
LWAAEREGDEGVTETAISKDIHGALDLLGVLWERVNSGAIKRGRNMIHLARKGTPDTWTELGWLESKTPIGKLNEDQKAWHARAKRHGVRVAVVRDVRETIAVIQAWRLGKTPGVLVTVEEVRE